MGSELRNLLGSAAALAEKGHNIYYINLAKGGFKRSRKKLVLEIREGHPIQIEQIDIASLNRTNAIIDKIEPAGISASDLKLLEQISPDAIISRPEHWGVARFISKKLNVPLIFYLTDIRGLKLLSFVRYARKYSEILLAPISIAYNIALSYLSEFTVVTSRSLETLLRKAGVRKVAVIHPPYVSFPKISKQVHLELPKSYVLAITTLARSGNAEIDIAIWEILVRIARNLENTSFVIVGTSSEDLKKKFGPSYVTGRNVNLLGRISDDNLLAHIYRSASCVLCPILLTGLSTRFFEALYYSKPIVTTETAAGYYSGLINDEHCIIEDDFDKWPRKILEILNRKDFREKLERGSKEYYACFSGGHATLLEALLLSVTAELTDQARASEFPQERVKIPRLAI
jgi:glycosyltransferase involved in cell wall biosynthesis